MREFSVLFCKIFGVYGVTIFTIIGFLRYNRKSFGYCFYLMLLTTIYNTILKNLFELPLPESCMSHGYGFPSGHMHYFSIFYIWCIIDYKNKYLRLLCLAMMLCYGFCVVCAGYHYTFHVVGAVAFAIVSVFLYRWLVRYLDDFDLISMYSITVAILLSVILYYMLGKVPEHVYLFSSILVGFAAGWRFVLGKDSESQKEISVLILSLIFMFLIYKVLSYTLHNVFAVWVSTGFAIPLSIYLATTMCGYISRLIKREIH